MSSRAISLPAIDSVSVLNQFPSDVAAFTLGRFQDGTRRLNWLFLFLLLPLLAACQPKFEYEFFVDAGRSKVTVSADGTARVSELFLVQALSRSNYGGVYLDIPQRFTDADGSVHWRDFLFTSAKRNGKSQYFAIEYGPQGETVYIGERHCRRCHADLPLGQNDIGLDYRLGRLVRREGNRDVLVLPAYLASIHDFRPKKSIVLTVPPGGVLKTSSNSEFGPQITRTGPTEFLIAFNERKAGRGQSEIEIEYPSGTFRTANSFDPAYWWLIDHLNIVLTGLAALMTACFGVLRLRRLRADQMPSPASLDQELLQSTSPGLAAVLCRDDPTDAYMRGFLGSVCRLVMMGEFRASSFDKTGQLERYKVDERRTGPHPPRSNWPISLQKARDTLEFWPLFEARYTIEEALQYGSAPFLNAVEQERREPAVDNRSTAWLSFALLSIGALIAYLAGLGYFFLAVFALSSALFLGAIMAFDQEVARQAIQQQGDAKVALGMFIGLPVFFVVVIAYIVNNQPVAEQAGSTIAVALIVVLVLLSWTLPRPFTPRLRKMRDNLLLLRRYMVGEIPKPDMSVELYERYLPFAVALGVEPDWTRSFTRWRGETGMTVYEPDWLISSAEKEKTAPA